MDLFVGMLLTGRLDRARNVFDTHVLLGSGFVVDPERNIALTCQHVLDGVDLGDVAFNTYRPDGRLLSLAIERDSLIRWGNCDLVAFRLRHHEPGIALAGLRSLPLMSGPLALADRLTVLGLPPDHSAFTNADLQGAAPAPQRAAVRALTGYVVTVHDNYAEIDVAPIKGMSGAPAVLYETGEVAGVLYGGERVALEQLFAEETVQTGEDGVKRTKTYRSEYWTHWGHIYLANKFSPWVSHLT